MLSRRIVLFAGGGAAVAWLLGPAWWRVDGPWADRAAADPLLPLPLAEMDWTLTDQTGGVVRHTDWVGRPTMAFLGFTFCPDVCPVTLMDITGWLEELGPDADRLNVALITVDPVRDTPEVPAEYLENFDARIAGLTGEPEEVARARGLPRDCGADRGRGRRLHDEPHGRRLPVPRRRDLPRRHRLPRGPRLRHAQDQAPARMSGAARFSGGATHGPEKDPA